MSGATDASVESGIGLDYDNLIMQTTVFSEHDTEFVTFNNSAKRASIFRVEQFLYLNSPWTPPNDDYKLVHDFTTESTWKNVSLFANAWTWVVPATIHHHAHRV